MLKGKRGITTITASWKVEWSFSAQAIKWRDHHGTLVPEVQSQH
jgi:hypothetical protein